MLIACTAATVSMLLKCAPKTQVAAVDMDVRGGSPEQDVIMKCLDWG